jgi:4-alpha-glucanotransferase
MNASLQLDPTLTPLQMQATHAGLVVHWQDAQGRPRTVDDEVLQLILAQLPGDADQCAPPLLAVPAGQSCMLPDSVLGAHGNSHGESVNFTLTYEDGADVEGVLCRQENGHLLLDQPLPMGYHQLSLQIGGHTAHTTLAAAPSRCFSVEDALKAAAVASPDKSTQRPWGLAVQVYSLRGKQASGIGDVGTLAEFCQHAAASGASAVAINPMHAGFSAYPERFSPYAPSSRLFLNPIYANPDAVMGEHAWRAAIQATGLGSRLAALEAEPYVDWPAVAEVRDTLLRWLHVRRKHYLTPAAQAGFAMFLQQGPDRGNALLAHACFEAIQRAARQRGEAEVWPAEDCWRDAACLNAHATEIDYQLFAQWVIDAGLARAQARARAAGMAIGLIADLAVGTDARGSHAWFRRAEILEGVAVGAPPDLLNSLGQNWGLSALSPGGMVRHGFRAFLEILRAALRHAGGLRIDHALGLARMWLIPEGMPPERGVYLQYPAETLLRLIALESWRHRAIIIGENLGTVPESFETARRDTGMLGINVLWFQRHSPSTEPAADARAERASATPVDSDSSTPVHFIPPSQWSNDAIATTTTHDLPTVVGWWRGQDIAWRVRLGLLAEGEDEAQLRQQRAHERHALWRSLADANLVDPTLPVPEAAPLSEILALVGQTKGPLHIAPLEDVLSIAGQPNLPGTIEQHPNWQRRLPVRVCAMFGDAAVRARLIALQTGQVERSS